MNDSRWKVADEVARARAAHRPLVALETTVVTHGLPAPEGVNVARAMEAAVAAAGATPATIGVLDGLVRVGMSAEDLDRLAATPDVPKLNLSNFAGALVARGTGSTTVAATMLCAHHAGIPVFATGGIGGVHRGAPFDESADLAELGRTSAVVVCAGAKSILDLPATLERLETHGVTVIGYRTTEFPGFFTATTGLPVPSSADSASEIARAFRAARAIGRLGAILVVQPPPPRSALDGAMVERAVDAALAEAESAGVRGGAVTPFLLAAVERATGGRSLAANLALLEANARLAGEISAALAAAAR